MSKKSAVSSANVDDDLEWIPVGLSTIQHGETTKEKLIRKFNENPFVPIGCISTATILCLGLHNFRKGNTRMSQIMMRARVAAQGLTVIALMAGAFMSFDGQKK